MAFYVRHRHLKLACRYIIDQVRVKACNIDLTMYYVVKAWSNMLLKDKIQRLLQCDLQQLSTLQHCCLAGWKAYSSYYHPCVLQAADTCFRNLKWYLLCAFPWNKTLNYEFEAKMKILSYSKLGRTLSDCAVASNAVALYRMLGRVFCSMM